MRFLLDANRPRVADNDTAEAIGDLLKRLLTLNDLVARIPGHLVVLEQGGVRFRPALGNDEPAEETGDEETGDGAAWQCRVL